MVLSLKPVSIARCTTIDNKKSENYWKVKTCLRILHSHDEENQAINSGSTVFIEST